MFGSAVGAILFALASPAFAHAVLESTDPSPGATVATAPRAITLTFSEAVDVQPGFIRVLDGAGSEVSIGDPKHPAGRNNVVTVSAPKLGKGLYAVAWRAISADSHPVQGAFTFGVSANGTGKAADALAAQASASTSNDHVVGVLLGAMRFGVFVGLALLIGVGWLCAWLWPEGRAATRVRRVVVGALALTAVATALGFLLQGPYSSGGGVADAFSSDGISAVWDTRFGKVWALRLAILVVAAVLVRIMLARRDELPTWWFDAAGATALALAATLGMAGHPTTGRWVTIAIPSDALHVLAMSIWLGGLVGLVLAHADRERFEAVAARFSGVALGAVAVIVLTGTFQTVRQVPALGDLWNTDYGRLLLAKLAFFTLLLGLATWSRRVVHGGLAIPLGRGPVARPAATGVVTAVAVGRDPGHEHGGGVATLVRTEVPDQHGDGSGDGPPPPSGLSRLVRGVWGELALGAVVLALTAVLVNTAPPRDVLASGPAQAVLNAGSVRFDTFFLPAQSGVDNELHVTVLKPNGLPREVTELDATIANRERGIPPIKIPLDKIGVGHYIGQAVAVPFSGRWTIKITAFVTDVKSETASLDVNVG